MIDRTAVVAMAILCIAASPTPSIQEMRLHSRVLIVSAPSASDSGLTSQRKALADWRRGASDRDVVIVQIVGDKVEGASDGAAELRVRYRLPRNAFGLVLIGKDGDEAYRAPRPTSGTALAETIDAMPMRRAGER